MFSILVFYFLSLKSCLILSTRSTQLLLSDKVRFTSELIKVFLSR